MRNLPGFPLVNIIQQYLRMIASVNRLRLSFLFTFDPQRLDVIGNLEFIESRSRQFQSSAIQLIDAYSSD